MSRHRTRKPVGDIAIINLAEDHGFVSSIQARALRRIARSDDRNRTRGGDEVLDDLREELRRQGLL